MGLLFATSALEQTAFHVFKWNNYVKETIEISHPYGLQESCVPRRFPATAPYRGTAVLFHGYSACPQQYFYLAPLLNARGFDVLLPLNPGHGDAMNRTNIQGICFANCSGPLDFNQGVPNTTATYADFVTSINEIMATAAGEKVVAGLSVGGGLAAFAGQALRSGSSEALYSRQLIMNPILKMSTVEEDLVVVLMGTLPFVRNFFAGWGPGCRRERALGRGGFCTFQTKMCACARDFGWETYKNLEMPYNTQVTVMYDNADPVINTATARGLLSKYISQTKAATGCVLPFTMHSFLSPFDDVGTDKWWMNEVYCNIVDYLTEGRPIPQSGQQNPTEGNQNICKLACTDATCTFSRTGPFTCPFHVSKL